MPPIPSQSATVILPSSPARGEEEVIRAGCCASFVEEILRNKVLARVYSNSLPVIERISVLQGSFLQNDSGIIK